ncbi:MAG: hypothetical protein AAGG07_09010 [Planctomycetota bacterium]
MRYRTNAMLGLAGTAAIVLSACTETADPDQSLADDAIREVIPSYWDVVEIEVEPFDDARIDIRRTASFTARISPKADLAIIEETVLDTPVARIVYQAGSTAGDSPGLTTLTGRVRITQGHEGQPVAGAVLDSGVLRAFDARFSELVPAETLRPMVIAESTEETDLRERAAQALAEQEAEAQAATDAELEPRRAEAAQSEAARQALQDERARVRTEAELARAARDAEARLERERLDRMTLGTREFARWIDTGSISDAPQWGRRVGFLPMAQQEAYDAISAVAEIGSAPGATLTVIAPDGGVAIGRVLAAVEPDMLIVALPPSFGAPEPETDEVGVHGKSDRTSVPAPTDLVAFMLFDQSEGTTKLGVAYTPFEAESPAAVLIQSLPPMNMP